MHFFFFVLVICVDEWSIQKVFLIHILMTKLADPQRKMLVLLPSFSRLVCLSPFYGKNEVSDQKVLLLLVFLLRKGSDGMFTDSCFDEVYKKKG